MMDMPGYYLYAFSILGLVLGVILLGGWALRRYGAPGMARLTGRGAQPRLGVVTAAALDPKRRLVIIRRDGVEHLLLIGGTQDLHLEGPFPANGAAPAFQSLLDDVAPSSPAPSAGGPRT